MAPVGPSKDGGRASHAKCGGSSRCARFRSRLPTRALLCSWLTALGYTGAHVAQGRPPASGPSTQRPPPAPPRHLFKLVSMEQARVGNAVVQRQLQPLLTLLQLRVGRARQGTVTCTVRPPPWPRSGRTARGHRQSLGRETLGWAAATCLAQPCSPAGRADQGQAGKQAQVAQAVSGLEHRGGRKAGAPAAHRLHDLRASGTLPGTELLPRLLPYVLCLLQEVAR